MNVVILQQPKRLFFGPACAARAAEEFSLAGLRRLYVVSSPSASRHCAGSKIAICRASSV